ncbi:MAG: periplasmic heavy metal sensor [Chitinispirillaceae bacterium]|nr:periplasmic heavy metal sensor [Chitinispirillaceae bacterium]
MKNKIMAAGFLALMLMLSPPSVTARPDDTMMQRPFRMMINDLKLTQRQQDELKTTLRQTRDKGKEIFGQMKKVREKVREELLKDTPSKPALDEYAAQLAGLHKQLIQNRHDHLLQTKTVLTAEQFSKLVSHEWEKQGPAGEGGPAPRRGKLGPPRHDMDKR